MDYFSDEPRSAPKPASLEQIPSCELVPEVSIILPQDNNLRIQKKSPPLQLNKMSYGAWKIQNQCPPQAVRKLKCNKENIMSCNEGEHDESVCKISSRKQVRFNSPSKRKENYSESVKNIPDGNVGTYNKPFEQIYMANIPNRHLDLSIIENPMYKAKEKKINYPQSNCDLRKEILHKSCENVNKNYNYNRDIDSISRDYSNRLKLDKQFNYPFQRYRHEYRDDNFCKTQELMEHFPLRDERNERIQDKLTICTPKDTNEDATVKELLKVVQQQNEQILLLQKQVALLLQNQTKQNRIEQSPSDQRGCITSQEYEGNARFDHTQYNQQQQHPKGPLSKFAIDVMTSFEVSIRPPQNFTSNKHNAGAKIQEINENLPGPPCNNKNRCGSVLGDIKQQAQKEDRAKSENDLSLVFNGSLPVMERCPSPENSIHVDMQDYSSDSGDESTSSSTDIGWTIYNNVMGQVNNILKKADNINDLHPNTTADILDNKTLRKVKEATMKHLKNVGINLPVIEDSTIAKGSTETLDNSEYTPTEISFAVKQLLMKYLPDDQLAKITGNPNGDQPKTNVKCNAENLIKRRPEFSFATIEYMKKYNLLTSDPTPQQTKPLHRNNEVPKILDVTALKQQRKLL